MPICGGVIVTFSGVAFPDSNATANRVIAEVPIANLPSDLNGPVVVKNVATLAEATCPTLFTVSDFPPPPRLDSFSPLSGFPGQEVVLRGQFFRRTTGVFFRGNFGDVPSETYEFSNDELTILIPDGAITGLIEVVTEFGSTSTGTDFVVPSPPPIPLRS